MCNNETQTQNCGIKTPSALLLHVAGNAFCCILEPHLVWLFLRNLMFLKPCWLSNAMDNVAMHMLVTLCAYGTAAIGSHVSCQVQWRSYIHRRYIHLYVCRCFMRNLLMHITIYVVGMCSQFHNKIKLKLCTRNI